MSLKPISLLIAGVLLAFAAVARADEVAEVDRLFHSGQRQEAMARAERYLAGQPRDAQMRFLRGVMLAESQRTDDAVAAFRSLTEDFPELPEPYNNLAVLYAAQGQYEKARQQLEMSIRTHPSYATAYENLGDVYIQLAREAYARAQRNTPGGAPAAAQLGRKLSLVRELLSPRKAGS